MTMKNTLKNTALMLSVIAATTLSSHQSFAKVLDLGSAGYFNTETNSLCDENGNPVGSGSNANGSSGKHSHGSSGNGGSSGTGSGTTGSTVGNTTGGTVNTTGGSATTTSGAATTTGGTANVTAGSANVSGGTATTNSGSIANNANNSSSNVATGGTGGAGGNASIASGAVKNTNSNTQKQSQSISNSGNSKNTVTTKVNTKGTVGNVSGGSSSSNNSGGNSSNSYVNNTPKAPVNTAYAPALTASEDTCMGSSSMGVQGMTFGLSTGSTWKDNDCVRRKNARELHNMGHKEVAIALLCQDDSIREAMEDAGETCPDAKGRHREASASVESIDTEERPVSNTNLTSGSSEFKTYDEYPANKH